MAWMNDPLYKTGFGGMQTADTTNSEAGVAPEHATKEETP